MNLKHPQEFFQYYQKVRARTEQIVTCISRENMDFRLQANMFSVSDLARHIPLVELHFYQPCLRNQPTSYKGCSSDLAPTKEAILDLYKQTFLGMQSILENADSNFLLEKCTIPNGTITRWKWLRLIWEHEIHHRGQLYQLLSFSGLKVPNIFGLSSEDLTRL